MLSNPSTRSNVRIAGGLLSKAATRTRIAALWTEGGFIMSRRSRRESMGAVAVKRWRLGGCRRRRPWRIERVCAIRGSAVGRLRARRVFRVLRR
jgi:hypothetical protein